MKATSAAFVAIYLASTTVFAQLDRAGNVVDDGGGSASGTSAVFGGIIVGAVIGAVYAISKNSGKSEKVAVDGCAVIGGLIGMIAGPLLALLLK